MKIKHAPFTAMYNQIQWFSTGELKPSLEISSGPHQHFSPRGWKIPGFYSLWLKMVFLWPLLLGMQACALTILSRESHSSATLRLDQVPRYLRC